MILATVGTQLPFPRLLRALDGIADKHGLSIVAQTCEENAVYRNLDARAHMAPAEFEMMAQKARIIVGHAGIGTILTARRCEKPLIVMPRRASLNEHRNEHQLATIAGLGNRSGIYIAQDELMLEGLLLAGNLASLQASDGSTRGQLIHKIVEFIADG